MVYGREDSAERRKLLDGTGRKERGAEGTSLPEPAGNVCEERREKLAAGVTCIACLFEGHKLYQAAKTCK